jgi:hypothetical protein
MMITSKYRIIVISEKEGEVANLVERGILGNAVAKNDNRPTYVFLYFTESKEDGDDADSNAQPLGARLYRYELTNDTLHEGSFRVPPSPFSTPSIIS